ncbi:MAG: MCE family protein [Gammaproteobacteria bacterium]|nr:MCE family protein [Gammaproteobacteria bacterium]
MSYDKIKITVGLFVIGLLITLTSAIYFFLDKKGVFEESYRYHIYTDSANFFAIGMPVKFSGFDIGQVDTMSLKDDGSVHLSFAVRGENRKWITENTILLLKKPLIGSPHINVDSLIGAAPLANGGTLNILISNDINDIIDKFEPTVNKSLKIVSNLEIITGYMANENSYLINTLKNLEEFSKKITKHDSILTSITGNEKATQSIISSMNQTHIIIENIQNATMNLQKLTEDINKITASLDKTHIQPSSELINNLNKQILPLSAIMRSTDSILLDIKKKLNYIDGTMKTVGAYDKDLDKIKEQVTAAIQKSNLLMDKIDNWMDSNQNTEISLP